MIKFSAVVGNPPYQLSKSTERTTINRAFASAIYPFFIDLAIQLDPLYISLITPSRWMTKIGQGINDEWVNKMIHSNHYKIIHDFIDANDCFGKVEIKGGVNYFIYSKDYVGKCKYILHKNSSTHYRFEHLDSLNAGVIIRDEMAPSILSKLVEVENLYYNNNSFSGLVSPKHFFDKDELLSSNWKGYVKNSDKEHYIKLYVNKDLDKCGYGWISKDQVPRNTNSITLNKVFIPKAGGSGNDAIVLGTPFYGEPNSVCSYTYLVIGYDANKHNFSEIECKNIVKYIKTRLFRYLVSIKKKTQDNARDVFQFVPLQDFTSTSDIDWSQPVADIDRQLYKKYGLTNEETAFIEKMIKPME